MPSVGALRVDVGAGQQRVARQLALLDVVERERLARGGDVVLDVRRLARLLVRRDDEALHQRRARRPADGHDDVEGGGASMIGHQRRRDRLVQRQRGADERRDHQHAQRRNPDGHVDVRGAMDDAGRAW